MNHNDFNNKVMKTKAMYRAGLLSAAEGEAPKPEDSSPTMVKEKDIFDMFDAINATFGSLMELKAKALETNWTLDDTEKANFVSQLSGLQSAILNLSNDFQQKLGVGQGVSISPAVNTTEIAQPAPEAPVAPAPPAESPTGEKPANANASRADFFLDAKGRKNAYTGQLQDYYNAVQEVGTANGYSVRRTGDNQLTMSDKSGKTVNVTFTPSTDAMNTLSCTINGETFMVTSPNEFKNKLGIQLQATTSVAASRRRLHANLVETMSLEEFQQQFEDGLEDESHEENPGEYMDYLTLCEEGIDDWDALVERYWQNCNSVKEAVEKAIDDYNEDMRDKFGNLTVKDYQDTSSDIGKPVGNTFSARRDEIL